MDLDYELGEMFAKQMELRRMTKRKEFCSEIEDALTYNPLTGAFYWNECSKPYKKHGQKEAGSVARNGYRYIAFNKRKYLAHRLAFLFMTGSMPPKKSDVDHVNGCRSDNRFSNLRICSRSENLANSNFSSGGMPRGVQRNGSGFMARLRCKNETHYLGTYKNPDDAHAAYLEAREKLLGAFRVEAS